MARSPTPSTTTRTTTRSSRTSSRTFLLPPSSACRDHTEYLGHSHTGGVPGRHELDSTQELHWAAICTAIVETGFERYRAHEFSPTRDPLTALRDAIVLCDV